MNRFTSRSGILRPRFSSAWFQPMPRFASAEVLRISADTGGSVSVTIISIAAESGYPARNARASESSTSGKFSWNLRKRFSRRLKRFLYGRKGDTAAKSTAGGKETKISGKAPTEGPKRRSINVTRAPAQLGEDARAPR